MYSAATTSITGKLNMHIKMQNNLSAGIYLMYVRSAAESKEARVVIQR